MALTQNQVSQLYVAILNQASDGQTNTSFRSQDNVITAADAMLLTAPGLAALSDQAFIEVIYANLLNKTLADDPDGIAGWVAQLTTTNRGAVVSSIVSAIADHATDGKTPSTDAATIAAIAQFNNRVAVSDKTSETIATPPANASVDLGFSGTGNNGSGAGTLSVTSVLATVASANSAIALLPTGAAGTTFTLTAARNTFTGTDGGTTGDDIFNADLEIAAGVATVETASGLDTIDGGVGADTLNYTTDGGTALTLAGLTSVETVNITAVGGTTFSTAASTITGVTTIIASEVGGNVNIDVSSDVTSVKVTGSAAGVAIDDAGTAATDKLTSVFVSGNTGALTVGAANAVTSLTSLTNNGSVSNATVTATAGTRVLNLNINDKQDGTITDNLATGIVLKQGTTASNNIDLVANAATAVSINALSAIEFDNLTTNVATSLTVTGDSLVTITADTVAALTSIDSSDSTGGLSIVQVLNNNLAFSGGSGADTISFAATTATNTTGLGDDFVTITSALGTGGTINAGGGSDTLSINADIAQNAVFNTAGIAAMTNFENLKLGGMNTKSYNMAAASNPAGSTGTLDLGANTALTVTNLSTAAAVSGITIDGTQTTSLAIAISGAGGASQTDTLNLTLDNATANTLTSVTAFQSIGTENLTIVSNGAGTNTNVFDFAAANDRLATITVTGDSAINLTDVADLGTQIVIDASAVTGAVSAIFDASTSALAIKGSLTIASTVVGGQSGDQLFGGNGIDIFNAVGVGAGATGADDITTGAGADVINITDDDTAAVIKDFTAGSAGDSLNIDVSAINADFAGALNDSTNAVVGGNATVFANYTSGTTLTAANVNDASNVFVIASNAAINSFANVNTALVANAITLDANTGAGANGVIAVFYDTDGGFASVGYINDSDANADNLLNGSNSTFTQLAQLDMTSVEYTGLTVDNFDFVA